MSEPLAIPAPKPPRKPDKRKKRKPRKKKAPATEVAAVEPKNPAEPTIKQAESPSIPTLDSIAQPPVLVVNTAGSPGSGFMSPRKQTLMRHKTSSDSMREPEFVSETKELKKSRNRPPSCADAETEDGKYSLLLSNQSTEGKASLFACPLCRIIVFHELLSATPKDNSSGTLLAHGEFEIFQLHNGDVTYLACGRSFVYPLLPKLKVLRTSHNEFVLPLLNPPRFWKMQITADDAVLGQLEQVLLSVVNYTNLAPAEEEAVHAGHALRGKLSSNGKENHFTPYFNDIPESPPSVPVSPLQIDLYAAEDFKLSPVKSPLPMLKMMQTPLTSAMASFSIDELLKSRIEHAHVAQPKPMALSSPFYREPFQVPYGRSKIPQDAKSNSSSMDSLLDEYEDNITTTKSIQFTDTRPASRATSHVSISRTAQLDYRRPSVSRPLDHLSTTESGYRLGKDELDDFPKASLSQYKRNKHESTGGRSRKSSVSELYSSISNWMEPTQNTTSRLSHSRSTYSLASRQSANSARPMNLNEIYRSVTQKNLARIVAEKPQVTGKPKYAVSSSSKSNTPRSDKRTAARGAGMAKSDGLSSQEVYKMLSKRDALQPENLSGLRKLFGW